VHKFPYFLLLTLYCTVAVLGFFSSVIWLIDQQVQQFLRYVKDIYKKLPTFLPKIFEQRGQMKVHDLTEVNVEAALEETFTTTTILTEKRNAENQPISVSWCSAVIADVVNIGKSVSNSLHSTHPCVMALILAVHRTGHDCCYLLH